MIKNFDELCKAMYNVIENKTPETLKAEDKISGSEVNMIGRIARRYNKACAVAGDFGYIGVGKIAFAENRMREFQRRIGYAK